MKPRNRGRKSAHTQRLTRMRGQDRERFAPQLPRKCFWCGCPLVRVADIPIERRLKQTGGRLHYRGENGEPTIAMFMTIDHVIPFASASPLRVRTRGNIVAACSDCNRDRTALPRKPKAPRTFGRNTLVCSKCRGAKTLRRLELCDACFAITRKGSERPLAEKKNGTLKADR